jgi:NAD(P)-dependent dehydrogenase (short-subunit alcohol dehydrogenase family)
MNNPFDLTGRVALVIGGNTGIGFGMAAGLARAGAQVVIGGRSVENNEKAVADIQAQGGKAIALACDVFQQESVRDFMAEAVSRFGRLDACFANAGGGKTPPAFVDMTYDEWKYSIQWNLDSAFFCYQEAARHMIRLGNGGSIAGTASIAAIQASPSSHYAAAKAGMIAMANSLAPQLGKHGIRVNTIIPGFVDTRATAVVAHNEKYVAGLLKRIPMQRIGQPADFAGIAIYLASDLSSWHTADTFVIDGGQTKT